MTRTIIGSLFSLGQVVITRQADFYLTGEDINTALVRHIQGDWGNVLDSVKERNNTALRCGGCLVSEFTGANEVRFCVFTDASRSLTRISLPIDEESLVA